MGGGAKRDAVKTEMGGGPKRDVVETEIGGHDPAGHSLFWLAGPSVWLGKMFLAGLVLLILGWRLGGLVASGLKLL